MYWDDHCFVIHFCGCGVPCGLSVHMLSSRASSLLWLVVLWVVLVWLCVPCLCVIFSQWDWCVCVGCVSHCVGVGRWVLALACFVCGPVIAVWDVSAVVCVPRSILFVVLVALSDAEVCVLCKDIYHFSIMYIIIMYFTIRYQ